MCRAAPPPSTPAPCGGARSRWLRRAPDQNLTMTEEDTDLVRLTVRLSPATHERLREVSHLARRRPAEVARHLLTEALSMENSPAVPRPAPPNKTELSEPAIQLLDTLQASISNLSQLHSHALDLGDPLARLAVENGPLERLQIRLRALGLDAKKGLLTPEDAARYLTSFADQAAALNSLARRLNQNASQVVPAEWHPVLVGLQKATEQAN